MLVILIQREPLMWFLFRLTSHIRCPDLLLVNDSKGGGSNVVCNGVKAEGHKVRIARGKTDRHVLTQGV